MGAPWSHTSKIPPALKLIRLNNTRLMRQLASSNSVLSQSGPKTRGFRLFVPPDPGFSMELLGLQSFAS